MSSRKRKIARTEGSRDHFLISRTDARGFDESPRPGAEATRELLRAAYPDLLWGTGLRGACTRRLKSTARFAALALRLDPSLEGESAGADPEALLEAARGLERHCASAAGFWGVEEQGLLAGLLPRALSLIHI